MDADYSHDPLELKKNLVLHKENNYDLLISSRYLKKSKIINWPISRRIFSFLANKLARFLLGVPISDYTNGYRFYSKNAVKHITHNCGKIGDGFITSTWREHSLWEQFEKLNVDNFDLQKSQVSKCKNYHIYNFHSSQSSKCFLTSRASQSS